MSSGLGTKGPEERTLPATLQEDMDLCLNILRQVLSEYDENLLKTFDTVRQYAVDASAERFSGVLTDTHPERDDLEMAVKTIDAMNLHDAQLLARAFATYFHLANLCEENYRVAVLHEREAKVDDTQAIDPVNEMTKAYHQLISEMGPHTPPRRAARPWKARSAASHSCSKRTVCSAAPTRRRTAVACTARSTHCSARRRLR